MVYLLLPDASLRDISVQYRKAYKSLSVAMNEIEKLGTLFSIKPKDMSKADLFSQAPVACEETWLLAEQSEVELESIDEVFDLS